MTKGNGSTLMEQVMRIAAEQEAIPDTVSNKLLAVFVLYLYQRMDEFNLSATDRAKKIEEVGAQVEHINKRVEEHGLILEKFQTVINRIEESNLLETEINKRNITWPYIKDEFIVPMIKYGITLVLAYIFGKLTGVIP